MRARVYRRPSPARCMTPVTYHWTTARTRTWELEWGLPLCVTKRSASYIPGAVAVHVTCSVRSAAGSRRVGSGGTVVSEKLVPAPRSTRWACLTITGSVPSDVNTNVVAAGGWTVTMPCSNSAGSDRLGPPERPVTSSTAPGISGSPLSARMGSLLSTRNELAMLRPETGGARNRHATSISPFGGRTVGKMAGATSPKLPRRFSITPDTVSGASPMLRTQNDAVDVASGAMTPKASDLSSMSPDRECRARRADPVSTAADRRR